MRAQSKEQQRAAEEALYAKRGEQSKAELKAESAEMEETMSEEELEEMASTKRKDLPESDGSGDR